ncbi:hypothetical protein QN277_014125 [Acacia crassicarpa]|uniref:Uncharacterized protein n=1 Tax=Acacia crassicarpa TaxID=499986 RepID=A0AAE1N4T0_9FABA|nr:hypothetical protein QN277_014125 [Acacia crassicarpa]
MSLPHPPHPLGEDSHSAVSRAQETHWISKPTSPTRISNSDAAEIATLLHLSFNQDSSCFAAGTNYGFRVFSCDPFREIVRQDFGSAGGIGLVAMLFGSNIIAFVGGGADPAYAVNKVMIWDNDHSRLIVELSFSSEVKGVRLRRDKVVVVLLHKILVYNFDNFEACHQIETIANPKGLCEISCASGPMVLVCPGLQKGQVRVELYASRRTKFIMAHNSRIACFALTRDGRLLATASSKGTLVRIFNTMDGSLLQEVRRGADRAEIHSLAFSATAPLLAVSSDKGTVHVFSLKVDSGLLGHCVSQSSSESNPTSPSSVSSLSFIKGILPKYFNSEWSVAQFRLNEGLQYNVSFGHQKNTIVILGMDGSFYRCQFDPMTGGEMTQLECSNFLKPEETF